MSEKETIFTDFNIEELMPHSEEASQLVVTCTPESYCASEICRACEDCDARVINLDVTSRLTPEGEMVVNLRVNRRVAESVSRSLRRYGYNVEGITSGHDDDELERARDRARELLRYLDV